MAAPNVFPMPDGAQPAAGSISQARRVAMANRWRESYNPLRGLTISRAITLLEMFNRGMMADLQWAYMFIEQTDPDLFALVERRCSAITSLEWNIKIVDQEKRRAHFDQKLADDQASCLRELYDGIDNLEESFDHLALATFRGFSLLEKHADASGAINHLEPLDHWNVVRDGLRGEWKYNPEAFSLIFDALPTENLLDPEQWIAREVKRHVNRIGLVKFVRQNLSQKDWDAFIETYGLPGTIIIGPANVPQDKEEEYKTAAQSVSEGGSGYLPFGSAVHTNDGPRGVNPFRDHLRFLQEQLILAGTGGLLTMLTQSGSGTLAGHAHQESFDKIAEAEARKISGDLRRQLDLPELEHQFPDKPVLAYFELASQAVEDVGAVVDEVVKLSSAGYQADVAEVSEKTGLTLVLKPASAALSPAAGGGGSLAKADMGSGMWNRASSDLPTGAIESTDPLVANGLNQVADALANDLQPLRKRIERILHIQDPEILAEKLRAFQAELPQLAKDMLADPAAANSIADTLSAAFLNGLTAGVDARSGGQPGIIGNSSNEGQPRDSLGKWVDASGGGLSPKENLQRGQTAVDRALRQQSDVQKAMHRQGLGQIDFVWGTPGQKTNGYQGGFGISHVVAKHGESVARDLPLVLSQGKVVPHADPNKRTVTHADHEVVLVQKNSRSAWVLTGYKSRRQVGA